MEKIKKALEKARQQQTYFKVSNQINTVDYTKSSFKTISYTQTKVVDLNAEHLERNRILSNKCTDEIDTVYKMLRTQVLQKLIARNINSVAVTSTSSGQGKTLTAINLAISLAKEVNYTVLLVDFDLRKPSIGQYLGLDAKFGVSDFILRNTPLNEVLVNPNIEHLVVLPGREIIHNSSEMLKSDKMIKLVKELKSRYPSRLIVFDVPPLLSTDDALAFSPYAESMLLVVEEGSTTTDQLYDCKKLLSGTYVLGTVLNKSQEERPVSY